jgi:hypothetical protein
VTPAIPARSPADAGDEPIRNYGDAKKLIEQRTALRTRVAQLEAENATYKNRDADAARQQELAELEQLRKEKLERETGDQERKRQDRRKGIADAILEGVHDDHKQQVRLMLPGLHEEKKLDLYAEATDAGAKAREALAKDYPQYFKPPPDAPSAGNPANPGVNLSGIKVPSQLTEEQLAKLSDKDFRAMFVDKANKHYGV